MDVAVTAIWSNERILFTYIKVHCEQVHRWKKWEVGSDDNKLVNEGK